MKIFLDFDDCVFDTENGLVPDTFEKYVSLTGLSLEMIRQTYQRFSKAKAEGGLTYTYQQHLRFLQEYNNFEFEGACKEMKNFFFDLKKYVYSGAEMFLSSLTKKDTFLLTYGDESFQRTKVAGSGLEKYFGGIFVTQSDKVEAIGHVRSQLGIEALEKVIFIDNRSEYFLGAKENNIVTIHMKRVSDRHTASSSCEACDYDVADFDELSFILNRMISS